VGEQVIHVPANSGRACAVRAGDTVSIRATTIVDFVAFDLHDVTHRFDQARTKANQGKIFLTTGDVLISKRNVEMFRIVLDEFVEGTHDLQYGTCSPGRWQWALEHGVAATTYLRGGSNVSRGDFPDHGCWENFTAALADHSIRPEDIPSPFNIFQHMDIDGATGAMRYTTVRPKSPAQVQLLALIDCLVGVSACPDPVVGGKDAEVRVIPGPL
jgi:uncharacterized protein YcgI (DUF1989 family)